MWSSGRRRYRVRDRAARLPQTSRKGPMTDEELTTALSELDEMRETAEQELEAVRARGEALHQLECDRDALMESYEGMVRETLEDLAPKERHRI